MPDVNGLPLRSDKEVKTPILNNISYDVAKDFVTLYAPAALTLYSGLAVIWGWGGVEQVVASGGLVITFLGVILKISSNQYQRQPVEYNGALVVNMSDPMKENYQLQIDEPWNELAKSDEIRIKVVDES